MSYPLLPEINPATKEFVDATVHAIYTGGDVEGGTVGYNDLPAGMAVFTDSTTRPTARTDLVVIFRGADPGANALAGDEWRPV